MADLINDSKKKTAGGDQRLGATSNPPDALPSVAAPSPVVLPAKQPAAREPIQAVHLTDAEDKQVAAENALTLEAMNDPLPGDAVPQVAPATAPTGFAPTFERGDGVQYTRPRELTAQEAANAYLKPDADASIQSADNARALSEQYIQSLKPEDFVPYIINQPELHNLVAETAGQRQSIFNQYVNSNREHEQYATALARQVEADRQVKNSSTSDGLDWVRSILGQQDGNRKYLAPVTFNQKTKEYDTNILGALLYPLGVIQNTVIGGVLDGRQLIRQLGNIVPPQYRGTADKFIRMNPLFKQLSVAQWVLNSNKYDDGKSNIIEALRGAQYSFSDNAGEGVGIGIQAGAFKTPKLPFVGEVPVNPSKLLGFAGDVLVGAKVDKIVGSAAKRLGIGPRNVPPSAPVAQAPRKPLPPSPSRQALPPARPKPPAAPRALPAANQAVVVLPPPRRPYVPQTRLAGTPARRLLAPGAPRQIEGNAPKLLMPSRVAELRAPLNATPKEKLQLLKPVVAKPLAPLKLPPKVQEQQDVITSILEVPVDKVIPIISKPTSPVVKLIKEQLDQTQWWGTSQGVQLATHLDELLAVAPQKVEAALTKAGVDVDELQTIIDDVVPPQDAAEIISEAQQALPKVDPVSDAVNESLVAQQLRDEISAKQQRVIAEQADTPDIGRRELDEELITDGPLDVSVAQLPTTSLKGAKAYHGTRVQNLDLAAVDPIAGSARHELGTGIYTYGSKSKAAMPAKADVSLNLPDVPERTFGDGVIHQLELNGNVLDGKAEIPALRDLALSAAQPELRAAIEASPSSSIVGILDNVSTATTEEAALTFQRRFMQVLRDNDVQHINAGGITSTIDPKGIVTKSVTPVKGASADLSPEVMLRNRLKMELDATQQTQSQFMKSTALDTMVRAESQALDSAAQRVEAAQLKTYDAVKQSGLMDDVVPQPKEYAPPISKAPALGAKQYTKQEITDVADEWRSLVDRGSTFKGGPTDGSVDRILQAWDSYFEGGAEGLLKETDNNGQVAQSWLGMLRFQVDGTLRNGSDGAVAKSELYDMAWGLFRKLQSEAPEKLNEAFLKLGKSMYPYKDVADKRLISADDWFKQAENYLAPGPKATSQELTAKVSDVVSRYVDNAKRSSDDYIAGLLSGKVPAKRGDNFNNLVRDVLDGHVDDPALISLLEGKYAKLYDSVSEKIFDESYSKLLPKSVKAVSTALDDTLAEIATHPPDKVPPELAQKLDDLLEQIDDEAFDRKFNEALTSDTPPPKNTDNPSSPCEL